MKRYYLYRQPILKSCTNGEVLHHKGDWVFEEQFDTEIEAYRYAEKCSKSDSWQVWKIEEVLIFTSL